MVWVAEVLVRVAAARAVAVPLEPDYTLELEPLLVPPAAARTAALASAQGSESVVPEAVEVVPAAAEHTSAPVALAVEGEEQAEVCILAEVPGPAP